VSHRIPWRNTHGLCNSLRSRNWPGAGHALGFVMGAAELEKQWARMDHDNDGAVALREFKLYWARVQAERLVKDMTEEQVREALVEAEFTIGEDVEAGPGALPILRRALKAHYSGTADLDARAVFTMLDEDNSGYLDQEEVDAGAGVLGSHVGVVMGAVEVVKQYTQMDTSLCGKVAFAEFERYWCGAKVAHMSDDEVQAALEAAGVYCKQLDKAAAPPSVQRSALRLTFRNERVGLDVEPMSDRDAFAAGAAVATAGGCTAAARATLINRAGLEEAVGLLGAQLRCLVGPDVMDRLVMEPKLLQAHVEQAGLALAPAALAVDPDVPMAPRVVSFERFQAWWKQHAPDPVPRPRDDASTAGTTQSSSKSGSGVRAMMERRRLAAERALHLQQENDSLKMTAMAAHTSGDVSGTQTANTNANVVAAEHTQEPQPEPEPEPQQVLAQPEPLQQQQVQQDKLDEQRLLLEQQDQEIQQKLLQMQNEMQQLEKQYAQKEAFLRDEVDKSATKQVPSNDAMSAEDLAERERKQQEHADRMRVAKEQHEEQL
jgi:Ca2+-binding EF-hand superfamily protein